ncbi:hypothetical protein EB796_014338 [Bugula neritina]|uniref:Uncharacterized protein n=1 Tax=Bugula neritina TaxID=10212 RepID=A0A7J7JNA3_BUGNE|nr:hypothetical protein EB796_014338 [Bugula neritina]
MGEKKLLCWKQISRASSAAIPCPVFSFAIFGTYYIFVYWLEWSYMNSTLYTPDFPLVLQQLIVITLFSTMSNECKGAL